MGFLIPTSNKGTTNFNVVLNNTPFNMRTYWQPIANMWYLDFLQSDNTPIAMGLALVPSINILRFSRGITNTIGELRVVDISGEGNAEENSLGNTALLFYFTPGQFDEEFPNFGVQLFRELQFNFDDLYTVV